jgi:hypothetical protein
MASLASSSTKREEILPRFWNEKERFSINRRSKSPGAKAARLLVKNYSKLSPRKNLLCPNPLQIAKDLGYEEV